MLKEWPHLTGLQDILCKGKQAVPVNSVFPSSHALDSAVPWLESFGNSVLHFLHSSVIEISKTIQLSQNISTFYMGSIRIIFQFDENSHWSCQQQHRSSCPATHHCSGQAGQIPLQMVSLGNVHLTKKCTVLDCPEPSCFTPSLLWQSHHPS